MYNLTEGMIRTVSEKLHISSTYTVKLATLLSMNAWSWAKKNPDFHPRFSFGSAWESAVEYSFRKFWHENITETERDLQNAHNRLQELQNA